MSALTDRTLEAALALAAERGLPCYPVSGNKQPTCPHGYKDATADVDALRGLWRLYPAALVGIATGAVSGIDVLDIDSTKHSEAASWWTTNERRMPATRTHVTRSGGLHLLFRHEPGLRCSVGRADRGLGVRGLDVRADGGGAIWWPANGRNARCTGPIAAWPDWLLAGIRRPPAQAPHRAMAPSCTGDASAFAIGALRSAVKRVASAPEGCRNDTLNREAHSLARFVKEGQMPEHWLTESLLMAATTAGLGEAECRATIRSALNARYGR